MGDMDRRRWAWAFTAGCRPKDPPMTKVSWEAPSTTHPSSRLASWGLERRSPSTHRATTLPPLGSLAWMASASLARAASIWAGAGSSGRRCSGSSVMVSLQKPPSRLAYSAQAAAKCFSFSLPTQSTWTLTIGRPPNRMKSGRQAGPPST